MRRVALSWEDWLTVIAGLRAKELPYKREHDDHIEQLLERHGPNEAVVSLSLTDDVFLHFYNWARLRLKIPWPSA